MKKLTMATVKQVLMAGHFGKAIDGTRACVQIPGNAAYTKPPLTIEYWMKALHPEGFLMCFEQTEYPYFFRIRLGTYTELGVELPLTNLERFFPGTSMEDNRASASLEDDKWHYLAVVFDGPGVGIYVDAKKIGYTEFTIKPIRYLQYPRLRIGTPYQQPADPCTSYIEEVRISNVVREITSIPTGPMQADKNTIGLWRPGEATSDYRVKDHSKLRNHAQLETLPVGSMDKIDTLSFNAGPAALDLPAHNVKLQSGAAKHPAGAVVLPLDGQWEMAENGGMIDRILSKSWQDAIPATVPGSVHGALQANGKIPDPKFAKQDEYARNKSFQTWWFKRTFTRPVGTANEKLVFDGVAIRCSVWLNNALLGYHEGMFGGPEFDIKGLLQDGENTVVVRVDPAPFSKPLGREDNPGWMQTVCFNNVYGWHYSNIPALGIWRSVRVEGTPTVSMQNVFVATRDARTGLTDLRVDFRGPMAGWSGKLTGTIQADNFKGKPVHFEIPVKSNASTTAIHLAMKISNPRLWWPKDMGEQNLYRMKVSFTPDQGNICDVKETRFGIRTIKMAPLSPGESPTLYNWTFVINGEKRFVRGGGWCTMDSSMDFSRPRYERFLKLAADQHGQMVRAWGSGMPETDEFYDTCDRLGLMVMQEWPTAWNSHDVQPYDILEETVRLNTLRLRNHPSLAMYGGGNESGRPFGKAIDMMGRHAIELDGTRPFHRGEGWGGSQHDYMCWWAKAHLDYNVNMKSIFYGEFGIATMPMFESVQRYLPDHEKNTWPAPEKGSFVYHTPVFNRMEDIKRLQQYSGYFSEGATMKRFIAGSQLAQVIALRHPLERARTRWPDCTGALFYKLNDNFPAASWATADWYGAPKISHYFVMDAFAPLHACVVFSSMRNNGKAVSLPVFLLDDHSQLHKAKWRVNIRAFNGQLRLIKGMTFEGGGHVGTVCKLGEFELSAKETNTAPLLIVAEVIKNGVLCDRTFYYANYEAVKDCMFKLPETTLSLRIDGSHAIITNTGKLPAVGASVLRHGHLDTFTADDNYFWLDAGESKAVRVSDTQGLSAEAWNSRRNNWVD